MGSASVPLAPAFTLADSAGNEVSLSDFEGKIVVLEWLNPDCPFVQRHYKAGTMKKPGRQIRRARAWSG